MTVALLTLAIGSTAALDRVDLLIFERPHGRENDFTWNASSNEWGKDRGQLHGAVSTTMPWQARMSFRFSLKTVVSTPFTSMTRRRFA